MNNTGFVITLAWPETKCKQAGAWYDSLMGAIGVNKNGYYQVGHAAVVLIEKVTGKCHYFDFGRYHAPKGFGRVRSSETDFDLTLNSVATFNADKTFITNFEFIFDELQNKDSCHGAGKLAASFTTINFELAYQKALSMQNIDFWRYGPFVWNGTNCSRFVRSIVLAGRPNLLELLSISLPPMLTPTPYWNVVGLNLAKFKVNVRLTALKDNFNWRYIEIKKYHDIK